VNNNDHSHARAVAWFYLEHFGFSKAPPQTDHEVVRNMALALITAASGDRELSDSERRWILGYFAAKGYPPDVIDEMSRVSPVDAAALSELMQLGILRVSGRILVYDAIRAASVDGYSSGERAAVRRAANQLGIGEEDVAEMERLVVDEQALKTRRIKVLMPAGHPNLDQKYVTT
jgi:uncharacterized membrane protein YebE (DUF533 family)